MGEMMHYQEYDERRKIIADTLLTNDGIEWLLDIAVKAGTIGALFDAIKRRLVKIVLSDDES